MRNRVISNINYVSIVIILALSTTSAHADLTCCRNGVQVVCESPYEQRVVDRARKEMLDWEWRWITTRKSAPEYAEVERAYDEALEKYERMLLEVDKCCQEK